MFVTLTGLTAGLILQTLLAWACHTWSGLPNYTGIIRDPVITPGSRSSTGFRYPADWMARHRIEWWGFGRIREDTSEQMWLDSRPALMDGLGRQATFQGFGCGWPMTALVGTDYVTPQVADYAPPALVRGPSWLGSRIGATMYPLWPRWPGILVNTLVFAAPVWLGMWFRGAWRTARRRKLGLCVGCGYAVKGLDRCPECGRGVA